MASQLLQEVASLLSFTPPLLLGWPVVFLLQHRVTFKSLLEKKIILCCRNKFKREKNDSPVLWIRKSGSILIPSPAYMDEKDLVRCSLTACSTQNI